METILLLGGSSDQLFAIKTAKQMGLKVICVDMNPNSPGFKLADEYELISTRDTASLNKFIDNYNLTHHEKITGVSVMGSDIPQIVSEIAHHLGSPGPSREAAILATNKLKMKQRFREMNIPVPWFSTINSADELRKVVEDKGFPLIIKPTDRSGARGVFRLVEGCDLDSLFDQAKSVSFSGEVMVEEYLSGLQISTETIMYKGEAFTPGFADRNYEMLDVFSPYIIENGGTVPSIVSASERKAVEIVVQKAALALGITDGVVKGDIVLNQNGVFVIELAARLSGGDFSESLIPFGSGVNIVEAALNIALRKPPNLQKLQPRWTKYVANRYFFPKAGRLESIDGIDKIRSQPWLRKLEFWYKKGEKVPQIKSHADRFGVFVVEGENMQELEERIQYVYNSIKISTST